MNLSDKMAILKALSEETRLKIVELLMQGDRCACEIPSLIGRTQSNTSMQLSKLSEMGILRSRKDGRKVIYSIKNSRVCHIVRSFKDPEGKFLESCCRSCCPKSEVCEVN